MDGRKTLSEALYQFDSGFTEIAERWAERFSEKMLAAVWAGCDLMVKEVLSGVDIKAADENLEREVTELLEPRIQRVLTGYEPFYCQHGTYEGETRLSAKAQPPQYDIAFILYRNERLKWPVEAKVVETPQSLGRYISEIEENFLTCRYAPFSSEAAMLAYLRSGSALDLIREIQTRLRCTLQQHPSFPNRPHSFSDHRRQVPPDRQWVARFRCHHLVLLLEAGVNSE